GGRPAGVRKARAWLFDNYALTENGSWMPPGYFFTGDAYARAASLQAAAEASTDRLRAEKYRAQADHFMALVAYEALEDVQVTPRDSFIPVSVLQRFVNEVLSNEDTYVVERSNHLTYVLGPKT